MVFFGALFRWSDKHHVYPPPKIHRSGKTHHHGRCLFNRSSRKATQNTLASWSYHWKEIEELNKVIATQDAKINTAQPIVQPVFNQKEDDLLKLVAFLIVEIVLKKDTPNREQRPKLLTPVGESNTSQYVYVIERGGVNAEFEL